MSTYFYVTAEYYDTDNNQWLCAEVNWNYLGYRAFNILGNFRGDEYKCNHLPINKELPKFPQEVIDRYLSEYMPDDPIYYGYGFEIPDSVEDNCTYDVSYETLNNKRGNYLLNVISMKDLLAFDFDQPLQPYIPDYHLYRDIMGEPFMTKLQQLSKLGVERIIIYND